MWRTAILLLASLLLLACGKNDTSVEDFNSRKVTLPDGTTVMAEVMSDPTDMQRGMMFRDALPEGRGMLFLHGQPGRYAYWMYQVKVPLDIIWLDARGTVVEISANTPPCTTKASDCPNFGGNRDALVVLELPAGEAKKHGVEEGAIIRF